MGIPGTLWEGPKNRSVPQPPPPAAGSRCPKHCHEWDSSLWLHGSRWYLTATCPVGCLQALCSSSNVSLESLLEKLSFPLPGDQGCPSRATGSSQSLAPIFRGIILLKWLLCVGVTGLVRAVPFCPVPMCWAVQPADSCYTEQPRCVCPDGRAKQELCRGESGSLLFEANTGWRRCSCKQKDLIQMPRTHLRQDAVMHICNPSTATARWGMETGEF